MDDSARFTDLMDRYLELSNVYSQRIEAERQRSKTPAFTERAAKLIALLEGVEIEARGHPLRTMDAAQAAGQGVVPTEDVLKDTSRYQKLVLERVQKGNSNLRTPRNRGKLESALRLPAQEFLARFSSISYAWDILVELASITVVPDSETLAARDIIYMHSAELETHLRKLVGQRLIANRDATVDFRLKSPVTRLLRLQSSGQLVDEIVQGNIPRDPVELLALVDRLVEPLSKEIPEMGEARPFVLQQLGEKQDNFSALLDDGCNMDDARQSANQMVEFGLTVGFCMWFLAAEGDRLTRGALRKNLLFCTRILLDEGRWSVARAMTYLAIKLGKLDNIQAGVDDIYAGTYMPKANNLFARKMLGEAVSTEVAEWDTSEIHPRYQLLKLVLLDRHEEALVAARSLLQPEESTGMPNMCLAEFKEWPIMCDFRKSPSGIELLGSEREA